MPIVKIMRLPVLLILLHSVISISLFSQIDTSIDSIEQVDQDANIANWLRISTKDGLVQIHWSAPENYSGEYGIWRNNASFTARIIENSNPIAIEPASIGIYTDAPEISDVYYYALFPVDQQGIPYVRFAIDRAVSSSRIYITERDIVVRESLQVKDLRTFLRDGDVRLDFTTTRADRNIAIYRSENPFVDSDHLSESFLVATIEGDSMQFFDRPTFSETIYYALVDQLLVEQNSPYIALINGENTHSYPLSIAPARGRSALRTQDNIGQARDANVPFLPSASAEFVRQNLEYATTGATARGSGRRSNRRYEDRRRHRAG